MAAMFQDTRPATLDANGGEDPWAPFRVSHPRECLALLRQLRDAHVPVNLNGPEGASLSTVLWSVEGATGTGSGRLSFNADAGVPALDRLVEADEVVAVSYMDSVKLQFDLHGLMLVRSAQASALQCPVPEYVYRFQRRHAFRVRTPERHAPTARFRHPSIPEMNLALRVLDVSIGGCALWFPCDLPPLQAGTCIGEVAVELDTDTRFGAGLALQHLSSLGRGDSGVRLGCEWQGLGGDGQRVLQRWIDQTQKRRRLLSLE
jgi:c-di-GMP-binding flagellar brake protein YcgR